MQRSQHHLNQRSDRFRTPYRTSEAIACTRHRRRLRGRPSKCLDDSVYGRKDYDECLFCSIVRFQSAWVALWWRLGRYQRNARPHSVRLHQHSGRQPHSRPLGLWSLCKRDRFMKNWYAGRCVSPASSPAHRPRRAAAQRTGHRRGRPYRRLRAHYLPHVGEVVRSETAVRSSSAVAGTLGSGSSWTVCRRRGRAYASAGVPVLHEAISLAEAPQSERPRVRLPAGVLVQADTVGPCVTLVSAQAPPQRDPRGLEADDGAEQALVVILPTVN